jgi:hypothetical protein
MSSVGLLITVRISFLQPGKERSNHLQTHGFSFTLQRIVATYPRFKALLRYDVTVIEDLKDALNQT